MPTVELLAVDGLAGTSDAFKRKLVRISRELGLDPNYIAAVISFESLFNPKAVNKCSKAVGLIQWLPQYAPIPVEQILAMSAEDQLDLVKQHYIKVGHTHIKRPCDYYLAVFSPGFMGWALNRVAYAEPTKAYSQNKGLDRNKDGKITIEEICRTWSGRLYTAKKRPPILVEMDALPPTKGEPPAPPSAAASAPVIPAALGLAAGYLVTRWMISKT